MTRLTTTTLPDFFRNGVGFDRMFDDMQTVFKDSASGYPPYNIIKTDENGYLISIAVAGFDMDELDVSQDGKTLTISANPAPVEDDVEYLHKGIAGRHFTRSFQLADHVEVKSASLKLGLLNIVLERKVPEELLPRSIKISK